MNWNFKKSRKKSLKAFTLPEVIVSFSVLLMVIVAASNILSVVIRTNGEIVDSMLAYGFAQEGLESMRFIRDSNARLGLDFDGSSGSNVPWNEKMGAGNFILINKITNLPSCGINGLSECLPVELKSLEGDIEDLLLNTNTLIYLREESISDEIPFQYLQVKDQVEIDNSFKPTKFHRVILIEPLNLPSEGNSSSEILRISSIVAWKSNGNIDKKIVLTTELTDWK